MYKIPLVSILICTYNAEKTIKNTLDSCLNQTYSSFEILIHDDQSKDKTLEVIESLGDQRIKVLESWKKLWPYGGLNFLLDHAKGEYIAIQDHDDIWHPQKLEKQIKFLEENTKYLWCWTSCLEYYDKEYVGYLYNKQEKNVSFGVSHTSLVFKNWKYRYDTSNDYLCDGYFLKHILTQNQKILHIIPEVLTLHYNRSDWNNYSNLWFKCTVENFKRYFGIYWFTFTSIIYWLFLVCFSKYKKSYQIQKEIFFRMNGKLTQDDFKKDENLRELTKYFLE